MKQIEEQLKQLSSTLGPSAAAEDRVFETVMARLFEHSTFQEKTMTTSLFRLPGPAVLAGLLSFALLVFFSPLLFAGGNQSPVQPAELNVFNGSDVALIDSEDGKAQNRDLSGTSIQQTQPEAYAEDALTAEAERAKELYASLTLAAPDVRSTYTWLTGLTSEFGGYIQSSSLSGTGTLSGYIQLRVPADRFYDVLSAIRNQDVDVLAEQLTVSDRQNELSALEATVETIRDEITALQEKISAAPADERPKLEQQLIQLQARLATQQDEISTLSQETDLASIELRISQRQAKGLIADLSRSFETALLFWASAAGWLLVPLCALAPVAAVVIYIAGRRRKRSAVKKS
ncbi:MAG: hypothetical protein TR69_WS6001000976 [candidate division WS6 bacterium OLB20]|uniref:DUF4349 domain-containing protein n=1 Tax=candidate division WS6 bacterium OLB20 TaxID=1617426 RepID=A0A136LZ81_9BACT|nr:MAG: hypothetical protein TR69_WS6001000976 [candidate division WS6 bacterium OLB20]